MGRVKNNTSKVIFLLGSLFVLGLFLNSCTEEKREERKAKREERKKNKDKEGGEENTSSKPIEGQTPLELTITNLESPTAQVRLAFYSPDNDFLNQDDVYKRYKFTPEGNTLNVKIEDLPYGEYAIATFQDVDGSGEINKTKIGVPEEPYAFSNNVKPGMSKPKFDECKFTYNDGSHSQEIQMMRKDGEVNKETADTKKDDKKEDDKADKKKRNKG